MAVCNAIINKRMEYEDIMGELVVSISVVVLAFVVHLLVWKIHLPKRQTRAILIIFFGVQILTVLGMYFVPRYFPLLGLNSYTQFSSYLHVCFFCTTATIAYVISYTAIEIDSPSLLMVRAINNSESNRVSVAEFHNLMKDSLKIEPLITELLNDRMVRLDGQYYRLTPKGAFMTYLIMLHRSLLGLGKGG